ncbi:MAG TPA: hypothetical protein DCM05_08280 [Elusimicrobia bacterium]|nr:hypothetical protein [Elusimicrobiota bacterium]
MILASGALAALLLLAQAPAHANPSLSDDFSRMMGWLTEQTAKSLAFNAGSTFDPPNEMKVWRIQPDVSLGVGVIPYSKADFPVMQVGSLAEKNPSAMLPDKVMYPNLTTHFRLGLPGRMDMGMRLVNVTIPKGYKLSDSTQGEGQINTIGFSLRRHFFGGDSPLLSTTFAFNRVFGQFNFTNEFKGVELAPGIVADSVNKGHLEWDVRSLGFNAVLSQAYGKWTPFAGIGLNHMFGAVHGTLEGVWQTPLISPSYGVASGQPETASARILLGAQRDGIVLSYFVNAEVKATGFQAGKAFVVMTGLAAPFTLGAASSIQRAERDRRGEEREIAYDAVRRPRARPAPAAPKSREKARIAPSKRWTPEVDGRNTRPARKSQGRDEEIFFIR